MSDTVSATEAKTSKKQTFLRRFLSTIWLWAIMAVSFVLAKDWLFMVMFLGITMVGVWEYFRLFTHQRFRRYLWPTLVVTLLYGVLLFLPRFGIDWAGKEQLDALAIAVLVFSVFFIRIQKSLDGFETLEEIVSTVFGFIYIVILSAFLVRILHMPLTGNGGEPTAHLYLLYLVAVTKFTDMGAYLVGSLIGKHKMIPHVSPAKTWQGFGGAILFAGIASFGFYFLWGDKLPLITPMHAAVLAVLLGVLAVVGDLIESVIKRCVAIKDSGQMMPGIGGILDLIDSLLFTAPALYLYLSLLNR
ncbi:MAG: phosphatidate cytidylyltransferase [Verrucomicrobiota bacterium]